jgi:hypothetical protein
VSGSRQTSLEAHDAFAESLGPDELASVLLASRTQRLPESGAPTKFSLLFLREFHGADFSAAIGLTEFVPWTGRNRSGGQSCYWGESCYKFAAADGSRGRSVIRLTKTVA